MKLHHIFSQHDEGVNEQLLESFLSLIKWGGVSISSLSLSCFRSTSPKECRRSTQQVSTDHNDDSEDETGTLTQLNMQVPTEDGIDNHDEFTR